MAMVSLNGSVKATPTLTFSGVSYYRWFKQKHVDGNIAEAEDVRPRGADGPVPRGRRRSEQLFGIGRRQSRRSITVDDIARPLGSIDRTSQDANSYGASRAGRRASRSCSGYGNQFLLGASYDHGKVDYTRQQRARLLRSAVRRQQLSIAAS